MTVETTRRPDRAERLVGQRRGEGVAAEGATSGEWKACETASRVALTPASCALSQTRCTASTVPATTVWFGPL